MSHVESLTKDNKETEECPIMRLLRDSEEKKKQSEKNLPKVLAAKRLKYYKAIGKHHLIEDHGACEVNSGDEDLSLESLFWSPLTGNRSEKHIVFDDSIVTEDFKKLKCSEFNLNEYIKTVKWFYHNWLGTDTGILDCSFGNTLMYLLAHSRDFNEPSKNLYTFFEGGTEEITSHVDDDSVVDNLPGDSKYVRNLNKLINDLQCEYDENKYQKLNLNVTYSTLLMCRRLVKSKEEFRKALQTKKTNDDYATLCPNPLDGELPMLSEKNEFTLDFIKPVKLINLILYGYLDSKGRNRKVFRHTCINYMEYNGIGLAKLFYEVAKLYSIDDYKLWDIMSDYTECCQALFSIADLSHIQNEMTTSDPTKTYKLFPFSRLLNQCYHSDLANKHYKNFIPCYALAVLVDLKLGTTKSFARKAHWTNSYSPIWTAKGENIANDIYKKINKN